MKKVRKTKKGFLTLLSCAVLGTVLAPAASAAELLAAPATGDSFRNYLPLIIGIAVACLVIAAALVVISISAKKRKQSGEKDPSSSAEQDLKDDKNQKGL